MAQAHNALNVNTHICRCPVSLHQYNQPVFRSAVLLTGTGVRSNCWKWKWHHHGGTYLQTGYGTLATVSRFFAKQRLQEAPEYLNVILTVTAAIFTHWQNSTLKID